jgi:hypothetical protein
VHGRRARRVPARSCTRRREGVLSSAIANRIVGLWSVQVTLGPCGAPANRSFIALNTFHAGGTLSDSNTLPGSLRSPGHGAWRYVGRGMYEGRMQFYRFLPDGSYDGLQDITQTVELQGRGDRYESAVRARVLNVDGTLRVELCGLAVGRRVEID